MKPKVIKNDGNKAAREKKNALSKAQQGKIWEAIFSANYNTYNEFINNNDYNSYNKNKNVNNNENINSYF